MTTRLTALLRRNLRTALKRGDLDESADLIQKLKLEDPLAKETRGLELEYLTKADRREEADALARQLLELFPSSPRIRFLAGKLAYRRKDYAAAERHFTESFRLHASWRTEWERGRALTQLGHLDDAEAILTRLVPEHPVCRMDLAWLYERKGQLQRALAEVERYLEGQPDNAYARNQRQRLRARLLPPEELMAEADELVELGEELPEEMVPLVVELLFRSGKSKDARRFVASHGAGFPPRQAKRLAWVCYKSRAYDLALDLFLQVLPENVSDSKFNTALETAAHRCGRLAKVLEAYRAHANAQRHLYGRMKTLSKRYGISLE